MQTDAPKIPASEVTLTLSHENGPVWHRVIANRSGISTKGEFISVTTYASLMFENRLFIAVTEHTKGPLVAGRVYEVKI